MGMINAISNDDYEVNIVFVCDDCAGMSSTYRPGFGLISCADCGRDFWL